MGINPEIYENYIDKEPYDFFKIFCTEQLVSHIVKETNIYAQQAKEKNKFPKSRLRTTWIDTNEEELEIFFGILLWMGLCRFPTLQNYWSKSLLYQNEVKNKLSRNRFELLLRTLHFSNNMNFDVEHADRLRKLRPLLDMLKERYHYAMVPEADVCIDETLVPFRGRLMFRQYTG